MNVYTPYQKLYVIQYMHTQPVMDLPSDGIYSWMYFRQTRVTTCDHMFILVVVQGQSQWNGGKED